MKFSVAEHSQSAALCSLMKSITMPGSIELTYGRDPDYFRGLTVQGKFNQAIAVTEGDSVLATGCRSIKPSFINGEEVDFGYLSGLRILEKYRNGMMLARGYKFLRELHSDNLTPVYTTTIIDDNPVAKELLTSRRAGLPTYEDIGRYITYAVNINRFHKNKSHTRDIEIFRGTETDICSITAFLNNEGCKKQYFPAFREDDFLSEYARGFNRGDFYVAMINGNIAGVVGKWDQCAYKQIIVNGYSGTLKHTRKAVNLMLGLAGYKKLPDPGERLEFFYLSFVCIKDDNPEVLNALVEKVYEDNKKAGYHYFTIGLHEDDKLNSALAGFYSIKYISRAYLVYWDDGANYAKSIRRDMVPYLELAAL